MDVIWDQAVLLQAVGVGLPEVEEEFIAFWNKERLGVRAELRDCLIPNFRAHFITFRTC